MPPLATIPVQVCNRWTTFICSPDTQVEIKPYFAYKDPSANFKSPGWDGVKNMMARGRVATGLWLDKHASLEEAGFRFAVTDTRRSLAFNPASDDDLRDYQQEAIEAMIAASNTGGIVLAATGAGKTKLAGGFLKRLRGTAVFICDELTLLEQSRRQIESVVGGEIGVVGHSVFRPKRVSVATIQTLSKHRRNPAFQKWFKSLNVLIIDEIHVALNKRNIDIVTQIRPQAVYGLTATLQMRKPHIHIPAIALAGPVLFEYTIQEGVEEGHLSTGIVCHLAFNDPLCDTAPGYLSEGKWIKRGTREAEYRYHIALNRARNDCVEALAREGVKRGRRVVVLVERRVHLRVLSKRLEDIPHQALSGERESEDRLAAMKAMDARELPLILASKVFGKGVDVQTVDMIIDASAMPGRDGAIQRYGRGVRKSGNKVLWYIDIADQHSWAAKMRAKALQEVCTHVVHDTWVGDASRVLDLLGETR